MSAGVVVCLMLKAPRPGFVKTRLAADLQDTGRATRIYRWLAQNQLAAVPATFNTSVWFTPSDAEPEMRQWLGSRPAYRPQPDEGDLGVRLAAAMEFEFRSGAAQVLFVGGDCSELIEEKLFATSEALRSTDVVIYPAKDGGYCLIGLRQNCPGVFQGISWSTATVLDQTLESIAKLNLRVAIHETLEDVDDEPSLRRSGIAIL